MLIIRDFIQRRPGNFPVSSDMEREFAPRSMSSMASVWRRLNSGSCIRDQPVPLKPKILDLLLFLIEKRGQLIAKNELMKEIWPDAIVEENNITVSMSIFRKTLGEARGNRQFIETVPREDIASLQK